MPRLLDLFCCAGGAAMGYHRAGFDIIGVDIEDQPAYPFTFHRGDALAILRDLLLSDILGTPVNIAGEEYVLSDFDAIHASPPCQGYTALKAVHGNEWPLLIEPVRELLDESGLPYVIENVQGSPLRRDLTLCGLMFDLRVFRHRYFELGGWTATTPEHPSHRGHRVAGWRHGVKYDGDMVAVYGDGGGKGSITDWQTAMGIDWITDRRTLAEAIPPAYTEWIGRQLLEAINADSEAFVDVA
jgi:hypothetical protein